jgi:hypothetical protein
MTPQEARSGERVKSSILDASRDDQLCSISRGGTAIENPDLRGQHDDEQLSAGLVPGSLVEPGNRALYFIVRRELEASKVDEWHAPLEKRSVYSEAFVRRVPGVSAGDWKRLQRVACAYQVIAVVITESIDDSVEMKCGHRPRRRLGRAPPTVAQRRSI